MIQLNDIVATYTTVRGQVNAVDGVNLAIPSGKIIGVAGESGCGKTTLLKVIYGDLIYPLALRQGSVESNIDTMSGGQITTRIDTQGACIAVDSITGRDLSERERISRLGDWRIRTDLQNGKEM